MKKRELSELFETNPKTMLAVGVAALLFIWSLYAAFALGVLWIVLRMVKAMFF